MLINQFVHRVENNQAPGRDLASRERTIAALAAFDTDSIPPAEGFALTVFFILIIGATLVSEDLACIGAGLMVAKGTLTFGAGASAAFAGIVIGDNLVVRHQRHDVQVVDSRDLLKAGKTAACT